MRKNVCPGEIIIKNLDLSSFESVKKFTNEIIEEEERIDALINNAGIITKDKKLITKDGNEETIQVNYLSHVLLTLNLMDKMIQTSDDPRIIFVSSLAHHRATIQDINLKIHQVAQMITSKPMQLASMLSWYLYQRWRH